MVHQTYNKYKLKFMNPSFLLNLIKKREILSFTIFKQNRSKRDRVFGLWGFRSMFKCLNIKCLKIIF